MINKNNEKRRINPDFDKTEHDFLMDCKRRGAMVNVYITGDSLPQTGKIIRFNHRSVLLKDKWSERNRLIYKPAISQIVEVDESDGDEYDS